MSVEEVMMLSFSTRGHDVKRKRRMFDRVAVSALVAGGSLLAGASTALASPTDSSPEPVVVEFGYVEGDHFEDIYDSIVRANGPDVAAEFFVNRSSAGDDSADIPGLEGLSEDERKSVLADSAKSAAAGEPSPYQSGPDSLGSRAGEVAPMSFSSATVRGAAINNNRSWEFRDRYNWTVCDPACDVESWVDYRYTTDPGNTGTKTSLNFTKWGNQIGNFTITSHVYANGSLSHTSGPTAWATPGSGIQWNTPHSSTNGKTFQAYYTIKMANPKGSDTQEYKTGKSGACGDPSGGGFRCLF